MDTFGARILSKGVRRTVQEVKKLGHSVGMALVTAIVYRDRKRLFGRAITTLASIMPAFVSVRDFGDCTRSVCRVS